MRKRIFSLFALLSAALMLLVALTLSVFYYRFYVSNVQSELRTECQMLGHVLDNEQNNPEYLLYYGDVAPRNTRITLVDKSGNVLYDSSENPQLLENHLSRPEISAALATGRGESIRHSDTVGTDTYYFAVRLNNDDVLRLSRPLNLILSVFRDTVPLVLFLLLALVLLSLLLSSLLTRMLVKPVTSAARALADSLSGAAPSPLPLEAPYEELSPFFHTVSSLRSELSEYINTLREERDSFNAFTRNMREGVIVLDQRKHVLTINPSALSMLSIPDTMQCDGQTLSHICRSANLRRAVDSVLAGEGGSSFDEDSENGSIYRFFLSPVESEQTQENGAMVFIVDVTQEAKNEAIRRDFAANVSHELKTPLTSIQGFAELIESGMITDVSETRSSAGRIKTEAARLITLINDIIRLSEIESGPAEQFSAFRLDEVLQEALSALTPLAAEREVTLAAEGLANCTVLGNRSMLFELSYNLLENAIKYNRPQGTVTLSLEPRDGQAMLQVSDTGIGIENSHLVRIFERFYRVDRSRSKQTGGTGLGLSIVKHVVEVHGGTVTVESTPGVGTGITVVLPLCR